MPKYWNGPSESWTIENLEALLEPVRLFIDDNDIEPYQVIASEIWCHRRVSGCAEYFDDLISIYNNYEWHWGFWSFNIYSSYTGFDYRLGDAPDSGRFIINSDNDDIDWGELRNTMENPVWDVLSAQFNGESTVGINPDINNPVPIEDLIEDLGNEEWIIRDGAALKLAAMNQSARVAIPGLLQLLTDEEWIVRRSAIYALSKIIDDTDSQVIDEIGKLKNDPEKHVRIEAALALENR